MIMNKAMASHRNFLIDPRTYNLLQTKHAVVELFKTSIFPGCVKSKIKEQNQKLN